MTAGFSPPPLLTAHCSLITAPRTRPARRGGFTLVEMLTVVVIIAVLAGVLGGAFIQARDHARRGRAETQLRELVKAWGEYYQVYSNVDWPPSMTLQAGGGSPNNIPMTAAALQPLFSSGNTKQIPFLSLDTNSLPIINLAPTYCDPWNHPYKITFGVGQAPQEVAMRISVSFPNRERYRAGW